MRRKVLGWALLGLVLPTGGCDIFGSEPDRVELAEVIIDGTSPVLLTLITSGEFLVTIDETTNEPVITLFTSDTAFVQLPFQNDYSMGDFERFLVRLINPDTAVAEVRMRVLVDGQLEYDQSATMAEGSMEFIFRVARGR